VTWIPRAERAFEALKESLAQAVLLAHPKSDAKLALFMDASIVLKPRCSSKTTMVENLWLFI